MKWLIAMYLPFVCYGQYTSSKGFKRENTPFCNHQLNRNQEMQMVWKSIDSLRKFNPTQEQTKSNTRFQWPVEWIYASSGNSFFGLSNYFDHNPATNGIRDFNCGTRTYNLFNYNHQGTDIYLWPGWWKMMAAEEVNVVAAAKGRIVYKLDGNNDQNCFFNSSQWNVVYLQHQDSLLTWYGHLKKNSLTTKLVGDSVEEGEFIGKVGSSGNSTGPHLHFEVYDSGVLVDPYSGTCNPGRPSLWKNQHPYFNRDLIRSFCTSGEPVFPPCPQLENLRKDSVYLPGDTVYLTNYYRDLVHNDTTTLLLFDPEGTRMDSVLEIHNLSPDPFWDAGGWMWKFGPDLFQFGGMYCFESRYKGESMKSCFQYGSATQNSALRKTNKWLIKENDRLYIPGAYRNYNISIIDSKGRIMIRSGNYPDDGLETQHWPAGMYQIVIWNNEKAHFFRFLHQ